MAETFDWLNPEDVGSFDDSFVGEFFSDDKEPFDPEGFGYDYETATNHGLSPDSEGHWPSRVPETGQLLKGRGHETWHETVKSELSLGNEISRDPETGLYFSKPTEYSGLVLSEEELMKEELRRASDQVDKRLKHGVIRKPISVSEEILQRYEPSTYDSGIPALQTPEQKSMEFMASWGPENIATKGLGRGASFLTGIRNIISNVGGDTPTGIRNIISNVGRDTPTGIRNIISNVGGDTPAGIRNIISNIGRDTPTKSFAEGGEVSTYTVRSGDIVSSIAQDHGTTTAAIQEANKGLDVDKIRVGQKLIIPSGAESRASVMDRRLASTFAENPLARAGYNITDPSRGIHYPYSDKSSGDYGRWPVAGMVETPRGIRRRNIGTRHRSLLMKEIYKNLLKDNPERFNPENLDRQIVSIKEELRLPEKPGMAYDYPGKYITPRGVHAHELGHMASGIARFFDAPAVADPIYQVPGVRRYIDNLSESPLVLSKSTRDLLGWDDKDDPLNKNLIRGYFRSKTEEMMMDAIDMFTNPQDRYIRANVMKKLKQDFGFPQGVTYDKDVDLPGLEEELTTEDRKFSRKVDELRGHVENIFNIAREHMIERETKHPIGIDYPQPQFLPLDGIASFAQGGIASLAEGGEFEANVERISQYRKSRLDSLREDPRVRWDENEKPYVDPELPTTTRTLVQKKIWAAQGKGPGITGALTKVALEAATGFKNPLRTYGAVRDIVGNERFQKLIGGVGETKFGGALQPAIAGGAPPPVGIGALPIQMSMSGDEGGKIIKFRPKPESKYLLDTDRSRIINNSSKPKSLFDIDRHDEVVGKFTELAHLQRGKPEEAMLKVQFTMGGGVLNPVVEHVGDLTHRMSEMLQYGVDYHGYEYFKPKIERALYYLTHSYGFEREMNQNIENNASSRGVDKDQLTKKINDALSKYADEHTKLPAYNTLQLLSRNAAIAVGRQDWNLAIENLEKLKDILGDKKEYARLATEYHPRSDGLPFDVTRKLEKLPDKPPVDRTFNKKRVEQLMEERKAKAPRSKDYAQGGLVTDMMENDILLGALR